MNREQQRQAFLTANNLNDWQIEEIPQDASHRKYARLSKGDKSYILMDALPELEPVKPFMQMTEFLSTKKFNVPNIIASDIEQGFLLLKDLGKIKLASLYENNDIKKLQEYYLKAVDVLIQLNKTDKAEFLADYNIEKLTAESELFIEYYLKGMNPHQDYNHAKQQLAKILAELLTDLKYQDCLVLRDYHMDNLMIIDEQIALLDYQDAVMGSPAYDLASLLEDARIDVPKQIQNIAINHYLLKTGYKRKDFLADYNLLSAQRHLKILGIFARQAMLNNNKKYLQYIPRVKKHLFANLSHPNLEKLKDLLAEFMPEINQIQEFNYA